MKYLTYKLFFTLFIVTGICFSIFTSCEKEKDTVFLADKIEPISSNIVYTDVNPDSVIRINNSYYDLDLNNDGVNDFKFRVYTYKSRCTPTECGSGLINSVSASISNGSINQIELDGLYPASLDSSAKINVNKTWSTPTGFLTLRWVKYCCGHFYKGNWAEPEVFKYLGLKLIVGSKTYYGWIRLRVVANGPGTSVTIKDFAYNRISNQQIRAGQRY